MSPSFTEAWFGDASCKALAELASSTNHLHGDVVEVGSWEGRSTIALAGAVRPQMVHAVDTWHGSQGEISERLAAERDVYSTFLANTEGLNVLPYRMDWRDYLDEHGSPIRLCFLDALHTYDEVREQLDRFVPLMTPGGIICGDDVHHPPIQQAVIETCPEAQAIATLWWWKC